MPGQRTNSGKEAGPIKSPRRPAEGGGVKAAGFGDRGGGGLPPQKVPESCPVWALGD
jgi:hypothetical protein